MTDDAIRQKLKNPIYFSENSLKTAPLRVFINARYVTIPGASTRRELATIGAGLIVVGAHMHELPTAAQRAHCVSFLRRR